MTKTGRIPLPTLNGVTAIIGESESCTSKQRCGAEVTPANSDSDQMLKKIGDAISSLSDPERDAVLFSFGLVSGLPVSEGDLAAMQNVSPTTVRLRLKSGLRKLAGYGELVRQ